MIYHAEGVVLRSQAFGEADRIVTLLTRSEGKVRAAARGVRRTRSRLMGPTQLFTYGSYLLVRGRSDLETLSQGEIRESLRNLREDLERMAYASYACELVDRMVEEREADEPVFFLVLQVLRQMDAGADPFGLARYLELALLDHLGYQPQLDGCLGCGRAWQPGPGWGLNGSEGGLLCPECATSRPVRRLSPGSVESLRRLRSLSAARAGVLRFAAGTGREVRDALKDLLDARVEGPLKARAFLESLELAPWKEETHGRAGPD
ncbi:DNA repair protein RecO [Limnochorda pilosa]|uniref:DNA repair protein RecO n=1 Tax=Limnochorda pilosa TaxID=1555112 RepID=A0A0K2SMI1_LIMPI|nr:DNA repair protein RecO [Limnochorda pilosa]BAS28315.1 DNA repair protein RecO [Limnochorda pilosa]